MTKTIQALYLLFLVIHVGCASRHVASAAGNNNGQFSGTVTTTTGTKRHYAPAFISYRSQREGTVAQLKNSPPRTTAIHSQCESFSLFRSTRCQLFFRAREEEALQNKRKAAQAQIPNCLFEELSRKDVPIPFSFSLLQEDDIIPQLSSTVTAPHNAGDGYQEDTMIASSSSSSSSSASKVVTIRFLTADDLHTIVPLCVSEFGGGKTTVEELFENFPWENPSKAPQYFFDWWDSFALPSFIYWTFRLKIVSRDPQDHALLVATLQDGASANTNTMNKRTNPNANNHHRTRQETNFNIVSDNDNDNNNNNESVIVGMVELSKQPPDATRNPSAYPVPLWYKQLYCHLKNLPPPDGWVTNLLVGPKFRGQGYSKLLMAAAEGVARTWGCTAIHLHCEACTVGGKVPQQLYKKLGFEMMEDENSPFAWMGTNFSNKIFMVEGAALLCFRKLLV